MTTVRTFLADDEPVALRRLTQALADLPGVQLVGTAGDGLAAREGIAQAAPDLVILDIEMPGCSGLDVARTFTGRPGPEVIFLTAYSRYATDAFEIEAADYLLKPVSADRLSLAIRRVRRRLELKAQAEAIQAKASEARLVDPDGRFKNEIWVPVKHGLARLSADEIVWIEGAGDYVVVHTAVRSHLYRNTMNGMEALFSPSLLRRVHRSALVNVSKVEQILRRRRGAVSLRLQDDIEVTVGASYITGVLAALTSAS
ncbi:MAG: DNA-binding response regulator [Phenylobacterium sp.]|jgi:DNA-binding LytR/AlgR family response regulator|nr:DNA-binding response regulator [Phenylobacterium sp.]HVK42231.1 LytTR family DNA-binding domain-containing protein [Phenylobacterium sp.]